MAAKNTVTTVPAYEIENSMNHFGVVPEAWDSRWCQINERHRR
jgi:hypothetical protein